MKPIVLVGEAFGANEVKTKTPFVGGSGIELLKMLHEAGVIVLTSDDRAFLKRYYDEYGNPELVDVIWRMHPEVYRTNVFQQHPPGNKIENFCGPKAEGIPGYPALQKSKYVRKEYQFELDRLADELIAKDPNLIIGLGNTPLWALCGEPKVGSLRGVTRITTHTATGFKLLPTYHPAAVLRQWELRPTVLADLMKAKREQEFADVRRPEREIWIEPTLEDMEEFYGKFIRGCTRLSVDIETSGNQITYIGFAPRADLALVVPFFDSRAKGKCYWKDSTSERLAWDYVKRVLQDREIPKVFQNGLYDIAFLWRSVGIPTYGAEHDTMLLHHALQPEALKGLGFLGSVYTDEGSWKKERGSTKTIKRDE